jgi:hypothetical protein
MANQPDTRGNVEYAVRVAYAEATGRIDSPTVTIALALEVALGNAPFPETGLRHWARILNAAADKLETENGRR